MSQQGLRQASVRAVTGTQGTYEGDWHALFDLASIPAGSYNGRLLSWINAKLSHSYQSLPEAMGAFAAANGATNWGALGTFDANLTTGRTGSLSATIGPVLLSSASTLALKASLASTIGPVSLSATATISGGEPAADHIIDNESEWDTFWSTHGGTEGGVTDVSGDIIELSLGCNIEAIKTLSGKQFSTRTIIRGAAGYVKGVDQARLQGLELTNTANIFLQDLEIYQTDTTKPGIYGKTTTNVGFGGTRNYVHGPDYDRSISADYSSAGPFSGGHVGIYSDGSVWWDGFDWYDNEIRNWQQSALYRVRGDDYINEGNTYVGFYTDGWQMIPHTTDPPSLLWEAWNVISEPGSRPDDFGEPHSDGSQPQPAGNTADVLNYYRICNITFLGDTRGDMQGFWGTSPDSPGVYVEPYVFGDIYVSNGGQDGAAFRLVASQSGYFGKILAVRKTPGSGAAGWRIEIGGERGDDNAVVGCVAETLTIGTGALGANNTLLTNSEAVYDAVPGFSGTYSPENVAEIIASFGGYISEADWDARTVDETNLHPGVVALSLSNQELSDVVTFGKQRIKAGPSSQSISVEGGLEYETYDDASGTNPSGWSSSSGTVAKGKYIDFRLTTSNINSTATELDATINGHTITFTATTEAATPWNPVVFTSAMLSTTGGLTITDSSKGWFYYEWDPNGRPSQQITILGQTSGPKMRIFHQSLGQIDFEFRNSGSTIVGAWRLVPAGTWEGVGTFRWLFCTWDLTQADANAGVIAYLDDMPMSLSNVTWVQGGVIDYNTGTACHYGRAGSSPYYQHSLHVCALKGGEFLTAADRHTFTLDSIASKSAHIAIYGTAAELLAGTGNKGSAGAFSSVTGSGIADG